MLRLIAPVDVDGVRVERARIGEATRRGRRALGGGLVRGRRQRRDRRADVLDGARERRGGACAAGVPDLDAQDIRRVVGLVVEIRVARLHRETTFLDVQESVLDRSGTGGAVAPVDRRRVIGDLTGRIGIRESDERDRSRRRAFVDREWEGRADGERRVENHDRGRGIRRRGERAGRVHRCRARTFLHVAVEAGDDERVAGAGDRRLRACVVAPVDRRGELV